MYGALSTSATVNKCHREEMSGNMRKAITLETKKGNN